MVVYPTLTLSSLQPGFGTVGFFYRTNLIDDASDMAWFAPSDGNTNSLFFYTQNLGGNQTNDKFTSGAGALGGNGFTTVPEPSTFALLALGSAAFVVMRKRRKS
jgi:hypothetical protein